METAGLLRGLLIGFSIAAPVGPIGVLCIRRTLAEGRAAGLVSGLGAASADAVYGCLAAFGLTIVATTLIDQQLWLRCAGGGYLCYLGVRTFRAKPTPAAAPARGRGVVGFFSSTFLLTLTNPITILSFVGIFSGLGLSATHASREPANLIVGVFAGSALWWLVMAMLVGTLRSRIDSRRMAWINRLSGLVIGGFGLEAVLSIVS